MTAVMGDMFITHSALFGFIFMSASCISFGSFLRSSRLNWIFPPAWFTCRFTCSFSMWTIDGHERHAGRLLPGLRCAAGPGRGIKGSKAKHTTIRQFYTQARKAGEIPELSKADLAAAAIGVHTDAYKAAQEAARNVAKPT